LNIPTNGAKYVVAFVGEKATGVALSHTYNFGY